MTESKKKIDLPFKIVKSEVTGGYIDAVHSAYTGGIDVVNYHEEKYSHFENNPLQSPFTEAHVGGRQHRHVEVGSIERPEAFHVEFVPTGVRFYSNKYKNSPPSYWSRDNLAKSPVNLKNIQTTTSSLYVGNYSHNYEVVQTSGRRITNNLIVDGFEASGVLTTKFIYGEGQYTLPELNSVTGSKSIIVERFSAPGGKEESSRGSLDREGEEYSPNSPLPFRNIKMRKPFYSQLSQSTPQGGGSIHGVNRNRLVRAGNELVDNGYVVRPIPSTDIQYSWVTASSITTAAELGGYQSYGGDSAGDVFTDISFISGSFVKSGSNTQYLVDNLFINSLVKDYKTIDLETNTFYIMKQTKIEQDFLLFSNGETLLSDVELLGDGTSEVRTETSSAKKYFVLNKTSGTRFLQLKRQFYGLANIICTIKKSTSGTYDSAGLKLERADSGEDLLLQYSFDGNTWITAKTILAGASSINSLVLETEFKKDLPYYLRFAQLRHSGNNFDNYAITDLEITQREPAQEGAASYSEFINSPYTYTTWTSLRNSEGPVSKALRANNIISVQAEPKERIVESKISGKRIFLKPKRAIESVNYIDPPVTFKYKPLKHRFVFVGTTNPDVGQEMIHTYTNNLSTFANKELIKRLSLREEKQQFYNLIYDYYTSGDEIENNPIERFLGYNYTETVWPREENTGLNKTRKRAAYYLDRAGFDRDGYDRQLGTQRVFWRDSQEDRKRSKLSEGGYYSSMNYLSTEESGSSFYETTNTFLINNNPVHSTSSFILNQVIDEGLFNSIFLLEEYSSEKDIFTYHTSVETREDNLYYPAYIKNYGYVNKRGYIYDISGEFNNGYVDFFEKYLNKTAYYSMGSLYRSTFYSSLYTFDSSSSNHNDSDQLLLNPKIKYLTFIGGGELNTGSYISQYISTISEATSYSFDDWVGPIFFDGPNNLYIGGQFKKIPNTGQRYNFIANYKDGVMKFVGGGLGLAGDAVGSVNALAGFGSDIYAGGNFQVIDPFGSNIEMSGGYIAKWNGSSWSEVGGGVNDIVYAIAVSGSDIYIGGSFTRLDPLGANILANNIAKWNGTAWSTVGGGVSGRVDAITVSGSDIYIGGNFTTLDPLGANIPAKRIAKWNGSSWSEVGGGTNNVVLAITVSGSDIYIGGSFTRLDPLGANILANNIAKWNGTAWSTVGPGVSAPVTSLEIYNSELYIGGYFSPPVAKWDGSTLSYLPTPFTISSPLNSIRGMASSGSYLYIGAFASDINERFMRWDGIKWEKVIANVTMDIPDYFSQTFEKTEFLFSTLDNGLKNVSVQDSGKKPFFDSYDEYLEDVRGLIKDRSAIPEFKISDHLEFYVKEKNKNFRSTNKQFLFLDGQEKYKSSNNNVVYEKQFLNSYATSDLAKKHDNIVDENNDLSILDRINIKVSGLKKMLPYNGFYPQQRTIQIANLYSQYVDSNLHGGVYRVQYENDYKAESVLPTSLSGNGSLSCIRYNNKYVLARGYSSLQKIQIYNSISDDPYDWNNLIINELTSSTSYTNLGIGVTLLSCSNGLNVFTNSDRAILHSVAKNPETLGEIAPIKIFGTNTDITGSGGDQFGKTSELLYVKESDEEKIIIITSAPLGGTSSEGIVYIITGSLFEEQWQWSDKKNIYQGTQPNNNAGAQVSILSCSSGYQAFFLEARGDSPSADIGNVLYCTSSDGYFWSTPVIIASADDTNDLASSVNIKCENFNNKSYVFFGAGAADIDGFTNNGVIYLITSSYNNEFPTATTYLEKKILYTYYQDSAFIGSSPKLLTYINKDGNVLTYCGYVSNIKSAFIGTIVADNFTERDEHFVYPNLQASSLTVSSYGTQETFQRPVFFAATDGVSGIEVFRNNNISLFSINIEAETERAYKHAALEPILSPGILFNTIKSGIAVDWPCITGSNAGISPYEGPSFINPYYPMEIKMFSFNEQTMYGHLKSNINYRIPFENIIFPNETFVPKDFLSSSITRETEFVLLNDDDSLSQFLKDTYIYGSYEPYTSLFDFSNINNLGPKRFSVPFVYRKNNSQDAGLYTLAMSNFLAETVKFFLKDEKMVTFTSEPDYKWKNFNANKTYYIDVVLEKSPDLVMMEAYHSDKHPLGPNGEKMNGRYFGYPVNKTDKAVWGGAEFTEDEARLIHNDPAYAPYTPPYFEGEARVRLSFTPNNSRQYSLQEVFDGLEVENIFLDVEKGATTGSDAYLNKMPVGSSVDLFGTAQSVEITVDETTGQKTVREMSDSQTWILSPKMETPVLDFSSQALVPYENNYSKTSGFGRGMWSGYGQIPQSGSGVKIRLEYPFITNTSPLTASLLEQVGFKAEERNVGQLAETKLIKEAIVLIPYLETVSAENKNIITKNGTGFNFIKIDKKKFSKQRKNIEQGLPAVPKDTEKGVKRDILRTSISEMITRMKDYVIPPEMNFLEYSDISPFVMYIFEFEHTLDQQDLADIWQGLMPKISYTAEEQEVSITHKNGEHEFFEGNGLPDNLRWLVFKVKKKAEYNYFNVTATTKDDDRFNFNKIIGRKEGTDIYSYNWPYDYFSLVEFAKVELSLDYVAKEEEETEQ